MTAPDPHDLPRRLLALCELGESDRIPAEALRHAVEACGADQGAIVLGRGRKARLALARASGDGEALEGFSRSLIEAVEREERPLRFDDLRSGGMPAGSSILSLNIGSALGLPLRLGPDWLGTLLLLRHGPGRPFDEGSGAAAEALAEVTALAVHDARILMAHVREHKQLLEALGDLESSTTALQGAVEQQERSAASLQARAPAGAPSAARLIGSSPALARLRHELERLAPAALSVLIQGEIGTGRDLVARLLHRGSARSGGPLVTVRCAAIPESLAQTELFGYRAGAFSGAQADRAGLLGQAQGGTIYLDGVEYLAPTVQAMLLRALQERQILPLGAAAPVPIDVRVVVSAGPDLDRARQERRFRDDLYHRLAGAVLHLPPLRERKEDLPELVQALLARGGVADAGISGAALRLLSAYDWPGNLRELVNELRCALLASGGAIDREHISPRIAGRGAVDQAAAPVDLRPLRQQLRDHVLLTLEYTGQNRSEAARLLDISRNTLHRYLREPEGPGDPGRERRSTVC